MRRTLSLLVLLAIIGSAQAIRVIPPAPKQGAPGDFVTLVFHLEGHGDVEVSASADAGATVLVPDRHMSLNGSAGFFATVQVPDEAPAGQPISVHLRVAKANAIVAKAQSRITVSTVVAPELNLSQDTAALVGQTVSVHGYVSNAGNATDRVTLRVKNSPWTTTVSPQSVRLEPGETVPIAVTVVPASNVNSGYRYLVQLQAISSRDPTKVASAHAIVTFRDSQRVAIHRAGGLVLVFGVSAGGLFHATHGPSGWSTAYNYSIAPTLSGTLSDYVNGEVSTSPIEGTETNPFTPPTTATMTLNGGTWGAGLQASPTSVGLRGDIDVGNWQVSMGSGVSFGGGQLALSGSAGLTSLKAAPDLSLNGDFFLVAGSHHEHFGARYAYHFSPAFIVGASAEVTGIYNSGKAYLAVPSFSLSSYYRSPTVYGHALLTTMPTFGNQSASIEVSGTPSSAIGYQLSASGTLSPQAHHSNASATVYGFPLPGTGVSGNIRFQEASDTTEYASLAGTVQASTRFSLPAGGVGGISGSYAHTAPLWGPAAVSDRAVLSVGGSIGIVHGQLHGSYDQRSAGAQLLAARSAQAAASFSVNPLPGTTLSANYTFTDILYPDAEQKHLYGASWDQEWGHGIQSTLTYERTLTHVNGLQPTQPESLDAKLSFADLFLPHLDLTLGYGIGNDVGLLSFDQPYTHTVSIGLGYDVQVPFQTPPTIVQLFGGRKTGVLYGRALVKRNGVEQPLTGVTVALGDQQAVTGADGSYRLRVSPGVYTLQFPAGLPATLGLEGDPHVTVVLNQRLHRDLVFRPVVNLTVTIFDDANQNGRRDAGEAGIPYAGVVVAGPVTIHARADDSGQAVVSGLPTGHYTVSPDPAFLPPGYKATANAKQLDITPPTQPAPVAVGAAKPPKTVATTYRAGDVSVFGLVANGQAPAGSDLTVHAVTTGPVSTVKVRMFGSTTTMEGGSGSWQATLHIPLDAKTGFVSGLIVANPGAENGASASIQLVVNHAKLFQSPPMSLVAGTSQSFTVRVLFKATKVTVAIGNHHFELSSKDGYVWRGEVKVEQAQNTNAHVIADGRDLGTLPVYVVKGGE